METSSSFAVWWIFFGLFLALAVRILAGYLDKQRIIYYLQSRGADALSIHWTPFGVGWYGERSDRIYRVAYRDAEQQMHTAACKTSLTTGVYFSEDRITSSSRALRSSPPPQPDRQQAKLNELEEENARLRAELAKLRQP